MFFSIKFYFGGTCSVFCFRLLHDSIDSGTKSVDTSGYHQHEMDFHDVAFMPCACFYTTFVVDVKALGPPYV